MRRLLEVAVAQPVCVGYDVRGNAVRHADAVRVAGARVLMFPELSLTGYELDAAAVSLTDPALAPIVAACADCDTVALVGAPILDEVGDGRVFIAVLQVDAFGVRVAYRKSWLGAAESARFSAGPGPVVLEVDGWRLGLGICKDTGVMEHVAGVAALGVDGYVAGLVHAPDDVIEQQARAVRLARTCQAWVAFASFAGPTGGGYAKTAGNSSIWSPAGVLVASCGAQTGGIAAATFGEQSISGSMPPP